MRFFRATELVTTLIEARDERSFLRLKTQLAKLDLLVLDELGYVPGLQGRRRAALRRDLDRLRAHQS